MSRLMEIKQVTKAKYMETGVLLALLLVLAGLYTGVNLWFSLASATLVLLLLMPALFRPIAVAWFGLSEYSGKIAGKVVLAVIYFIILLPVALARQAIGRDQLLLRRFKKGKESVFVTRNHIYTAEDIHKPY